MTWQVSFWSSPQTSFWILSISAARAWTKAAPSSPAPAPTTRSVTSVMSVRISAVWPGHFFSSSREPGIQPFLT